MKLHFRLLVLWAVAWTGLAAENAPARVFEMRKVLDGPTGETEEMVLVHGSGEGARPIQETLHVAKAPVIVESDVQRATTRRDAITGHPQVEIEFTDDGRERFAQVTEGNVNKRLAVLVDGKVLSAPVIRTKIPGGKAVISGNFNEKQARAFAARINKAVRAGGKSKLKPWPYGPYDQRRVTP